MAEDSPSKPRGGGRPRSKAFLRISLENAYEDLGVSPLTSNDEIAARIGALLAEAKRKVRAKATKSVDDPDEREILRLQKIDEEIGDPKRRKIYDEKYPQNILLTVQPSLAEQAWLRHRKAGLVSEWVYEMLGEAAFAPTPHCLSLWAPSGVERPILDFLAEHSPTDMAPQAPAVPLPIEQQTARNLDVEDLDRLTKEG
jgi:hypothetical protein